MLAHLSSICITTWSTDKNECSATIQPLLRMALPCERRPPPCEIATWTNSRRRSERVTYCQMIAPCSSPTSNQPIPTCLKLVFHIHKYVMTLGNHHDLP